MVTTQDRSAMPAWAALLAWGGALFALNVMGFLAAGLADPAGFDCSDPQVPNRTVLTDIGLWFGAVLGLVVPAVLLAGIPKLGGRWWPIPLGLLALVPTFAVWRFLFDAAAMVC